MSAANTTTVLIVDDSVGLRRRLIEMLAPVAGLKVVGEAASAPEAILLIHELKPDVVILDIQMPEGGGMGVLAGVKRDYPDTVVIILTNHPEPQYQKRCRDLKADYFLSKSTDSKLLVGIGAQLARAKGHDPEDQPA